LIRFAVLLLLPALLACASGPSADEIAAGRQQAIAADAALQRRKDDCGRLYRMLGDQTLTQDQLASIRDRMGAVGCRFIGIP
jgi:hypothetical protein